MFQTSSDPFLKLYSRINVAISRNCQSLNHKIYFMYNMFTYQWIYNTALERVFIINRYKVFYSEETTSILV